MWGETPKNVLKPKNTPPLIPCVREQTPEHCNIKENKQDQLAKGRTNLLRCLTPAMPKIMAFPPVNMH